MSKRNPNNAPSSKGFAGNNFQPQQIPLRQRNLPYLQGNEHYEEQSNQGLDLSLRRNPDVAEGSECIQPPRNRVIFSGLPTAGSGFQGYSGVASGPPPLTAPSVTSQPTRSTGYTPLDQFTPLESWQFMNLLHTVTSQTNALLALNYPGHPGGNPQFTLQQPVNIPDPRQMGQRYIPHPGPLLPTPAHQASGNFCNPLNPSEQTPYMDPGPSTSQYNTFAGPSKEQHQHTILNASTSHGPPLAKRPKKRSGESQVLERTNSVESMAHLRVFSSRHISGQTATTQAHSGQSQTQVTHQDVMEDSKNIGAKKKANVKGGLDGGDEIGVDKTKKNKATIINCAVVYPNPVNDIDSATLNKNDSLMQNGMSNAMGNVEITRKIRNNESTNKESKKNGPTLLPKKIVHKIKSDSKFTIDNSISNTFNDRKLHSTQLHTDLFKKPLPIKDFRSKKIAPRVENEKRLLNKTTDLPKVTWPIFKNTKVAQATLTNDLEEKESVDTASDPAGFVEPTDNAIGQIYEQANGTNDTAIVRINKNKIIIPNIEQPVPEKRRTRKFAQHDKTNKTERSNLQKDKPDFRLDKSLLRIDKLDNCDDKPDFSNDESVPRDINPVFRNEKPIIHSGKSVSFQSESAVQTDKTVYNDKIIRPSVIWYNPGSQNHAGNNFAETTVPLTYANNKGPFPAQQIISSNRNEDSCESKFNNRININQEQPNIVSAGDTGGQIATKPALHLEPMWLLDIIAHDPQIYDFITGTPYTNNGQDGGSSYEYYRLTNFQLCHLRVIPDDRFWEAYVLDEVMLDAAGVPAAMPERKDELEAFSREIIIEVLRRDYNVQDVETLRLCVINYLRNYPELRLPLMEKLVKGRAVKK